MRQKLRLKMKQFSKSTRKQRIQNIMQAAQMAAQSKDQYELYQHIRKLAPKSTQTRIMLRDDNGQLCNPSQAADLLAQWIQDVYAGPRTTSTALVWPFEARELKSVFQTFAANKALAPMYLPSVIWKHFATELSQVMHQQATAWADSHSAPPVEWGQGTLVPNKPAGCPQNLRPIALLEPWGKCCMGRLSKCILNATLHRLRTLPQFAYLPSRGCLEAIYRTTQHCLDIRDLHVMLQNKHHNHEAGNPRPSIAGGLLLSLDLSRAFDCVDRIVLMQALRHMGVQDSHIAFLEAVYANTSFQFTHRDETRSVPTWRGIRQGCKSAPTLWCIFTGYLLELLGVCTSTDWMLQCNTLYVITLMQKSVAKIEAIFGFRFFFAGLVRWRPVQGTMRRGIQLLLVHTNKEEWTEPPPGN